MNFSNLPALLNFGWTTSSWLIMPLNAWCWPREAATAFFCCMSALL